MNKITLKISGMSCNHCVMHVTKALEGLDGVREAKVSLADKNAEVTFDESKADKAKMAEAVKEAGYSVE
jgi:copper ion binding protein